MIFTFYSYKGGVGRSMAMANVAHWLYQRGLNVVLVDWDLEAPGIESFFTQSPEELEKIRSQLGVIDLLYAYMRQFRFLPKEKPFDALPPLKESLCQLHPPATGSGSAPGTLRLLSAGWRAGDRFTQYAESVQSFSWAEFYSAYNGEQYFDWFRNELRLLGDVILIDSRTGVTEMGGVCTRQLADTVAVMCAPNMQNVQGCIDMVQSFRAQGLQEARGGRELSFVILPARVDDADSLGFKKFRDEVFTPKVSPLTPEVFKEWKRTSWDLEIPYKAEYSYREGLVTGVPGANEKLDIAYRNLAAHLALFTPEDHPLWSACEAELRVLATKAGKEFGTKIWVTIEKAFDALPDDVARAAQAALLRMIRYSPQSPELDSPRRAASDEIEFLPEFLPEFHSRLQVLSTLVDRGLVSRVKETPENSQTERMAAEFELPHPSLIQEWPRLKRWVREEREFLLLRQEIAEQALKWRSSDKDPAALLNHTQLAAAQELRSRDAERLNGIEQEFLRLSEEADLAALRREEEVRRLEEEKARAEEE